MPPTQMSVEVQSDSDPPEGAPPAPADRRSRRRRIVIAVAVGLAVLLTIGGYAGWRAWAARAVDGVHVGWLGEPVCTGTTLRPNGHAIEWAREMSCVVTVVVRNDGPAGVRVTGVVLPYVGPGGGSVIKAAPIDGQSPAPVTRSDIDAALDLTHSIEAGETWTFRTRLVFRPDGCTSAGTLSLHHWPTVGVSARGRDALVLSNRSLVVHSSRQNPGCRG